MKMNRRKTRLIRVGDVEIGGNSPISVQSMTNTVTKDVKNTVKQIKGLESVNCDIVRVAISDMDDVNAIKEIKKHISIPIIADIQFNYRLAIESVKNGVE